MSEFSLKFRGVRGSYPISSKDFLEYGGNTACIEVNVGGHLIILDAGTGMISVGDELMEKYITSGFTPEERTPVRATVLLSHIHQDHIQGFTFFRPLHLKSTVLSVFGSVCEEENLSDELSNVLFGKTFPLDLGDIAGKLDIKNITSNDLIILRHGSEPIICKSQENILPDDVVISCFTGIPPLHSEYSSSDAPGCSLRYTDSQRPNPPDPPPQSDADNVWRPARSCFRLQVSSF